MDESQLEELLKKGLEEIYKAESSEHEVKPGVYYPSYIGSCLRKQYYIYTTGERATHEDLVVMMTGVGVHEIVAKALGVAAKVEGVETKISLQVNDKIRLSGRVDVIIIDMEGKRYVIEVKSVSTTPDSPREGHALQLQVYLHALGVDEGYLLYWNKRNGEIKAFKVTKDDERLKEAFERAIMLDYHVTVRVPPEPESYINGKLWECKRCPFLSECNPGPL